MSRTKAVQIGVTFGREDISVLEALQELNEKSGVPISHIIRQAVKASLLEDETALASLKAYRNFSGVPLPAGTVRVKALAG